MEIPCSGDRPAKVQARQGKEGGGVTMSMEEQGIAGCGTGYEFNQSGVAASFGRMRDGEEERSPPGTKERKERTKYFISVLRWNPITLSQDIRTLIQPREMV
jgi:hypothetical protein